MNGYATIEGDMEEGTEYQPSPQKLPERNPLTHAAHRRSFGWQVMLPFGLFVLVFVALIVGVSLAAVSGSSQLSRWADVALIWQLPLPIILSLLCMVIHIGILYGVIRLTGVIPGVARLVHNYLLLVQSKVNTISDQIVAPIIRTSASQAKIQASLRAIRRKKANQ